jgi:hypothetical protein
MHIALQLWTVRDLVDRDMHEDRERVEDSRQTIFSPHNYSRYSRYSRILDDLLDDLHERHVRQRQHHERR